MTELILAEVVTRYRALAGAGVAAEHGRRLLRSQRYQLVFVDAEIFEAALSRVAKFADKRLSLTDCASFEIIDRLKLDGAFTFDHDFRDCGFRSFPES